MFTVDVITLAPRVLQAALRDGVPGRAWESGRLRCSLWDLREFSRDPHRKVDDVPYGGGSGMVMMPQPLVDAAEHVLALRDRRPEAFVLSARGVPFDQRMARRLAERAPGLLLVCGRYEGIDARVAPLIGATELSVGDFVLSAGEPAALVVIDAVARLLPGALGDPDSAKEESFEEQGSAVTPGLLEYPQYTRPRRFRGMDVPEVLLSGDHAAVARWRREASLRVTLDRRPELLDRAALPPHERQRLDDWRRELSSTETTW